jgi:hypothetical protein
MMEVLSGYPSDVVAVLWHDEVSPDDHRSNLDVQERDRLAGRHDIRLLARLAGDIRQTSKRAGFDDSVLGVGHWSDFGKIAIVTDERWVRHMVQFFAPFVHGPVRVFSNAEADEARAWIARRDFN